MDSYVIRIYRRNIEDPRQVVGLVEIISSQEQRSFRTFDELREILNPMMKRQSKGKNTGKENNRDS